MKYKGIELKEITEPQIFNPPKKNNFDFVAF